MQSTFKSSFLLKAITIVDLEILEKLCKKPAASFVSHVLTDPNKHSHGFAQISRNHHKDSCFEHDYGAKE